MHSLWLLLGPITGLITSRMIGQPLLRGMFLGAGGALIGAGIHRLLYMERRGVSLPASVLVAALIVRTKEHDEVTAEAHATAADTAGIATNAAGAAAVQMPLALLGALFSSPVGPLSLLSLVRVIGRNLPLVLLLTGIGMLFWPKNADEVPENAAADEFTPAAGLRPNGRYSSSDVHAA